LLVTARRSPWKTLPPMLPVHVLRWL
jgi:hypothetical protein